MVTISGEYLGGVATLMTHGPSGAKLQTDAPKDNGGNGEDFSPTDLLATAYGSCVMTIMALRAKDWQLDMSGLRLQVEKQMTQTAPRRVAKLVVRVQLPQNLSPNDVDRLVDAGKTCPVALSVNLAEGVEWHVNS